MGSSDTDKQDKEPKTPPPPSSTQEQPSGTAIVNAEWPGFQAYSPIPPHGYMASSPQAHPYMWGVQHMMPPYGTPPHPYMAMYPHGGMYAHPSIPPGSYPFSPFAMPPNGVAEAYGNTLGNATADSKPSEGKEKLPIKRSKGSLGSLNVITGKSNRECKTVPSANGACSKSAESASDGSSEGSDGNSQNDTPAKLGGRQEASEVEGCQNGHVTQNCVPNASHTMVNHGIPVMAMTVAGAAAPVSGPTTNLNIGMDYWASPAIQGKVTSAPVVAGMVTPGSRESQLWLQDERELKRQKRKQSNRESARRSRLRKQAECDELAQRADALKEENASLRSELNRFRNEYEILVAENTTLKERLGEIPEDLASIPPAQCSLSKTQESGKANEKQSGP